MGAGSLGFFVESLVALLLLVTIGYCLVVNRKLERLRSDQSELKQIIRELNVATNHAENAIAGLQKSAGNAEDMLGEHVRSARDLANRLAHGIAQGEEIHSKLTLVNQMYEREASSTPGTARRRTSHGLRASKFGLGLLNAAARRGQDDDAAEAA